MNVIVRDGKTPDQPPRNPSRLQSVLTLESSVPAVASKGRVSSCTSISLEIILCTPPEAFDHEGSGLASTQSVLRGTDV